MKYFLLFLPLVILISCQDNKSSTPNKEPEQKPSATVESNFTKVYKSDGAKQCQSTAIPLKTMWQDLLTAGIDVVCSQKDQDDVIHEKSCGANTGSINVYKINKSNLTDALSLGYKAISKAFKRVIKTCKVIKPVAPIKFVKVFKRDIALQCQGQSTSPDSMAKELIASGIDVACAQKNSDGLLHPAVCGGISGNINVFKISKNDVVKAQISGFHPVSELPEYVDSVCKPKLEKVFKRFTYRQCGGPNLFLPGEQNVNQSSSSQPSVVAQQLISAGIAVTCSQRGYDGVSSNVFTAVCGGLVIGMNVFEISKYHVGKAKKLGFFPVSLLPKYVDSACKN
jgi:hypothetical protein